MIKQFILIILSYHIIQSSLVIPLSKNCIQSFQNECLRVHNEIRENHSALPLTWNQTLSNLALNYSNYLASIDSLSPSNIPDLSDFINVFYSSQNMFKQAHCDRVAKNSITQFNIGSPSFVFNVAQLNPGLYQNGTKKIGCGIALNLNNFVYTVMFYSPKFSKIS